MSNRHSGIVINQNRHTTASVGLSNWKYQQFYLPSDFARGKKADEVRFPDLTGFQIMLLVGNASLASLQWTLDRYNVGHGWVNLTSGTTNGSHEAGKVWFDVYFPTSVATTVDDTQELFRIGIKSLAGITGAWYVTPAPLNLQAFDSNGTTPLFTSAAFNFRLLGSTADNGTDPLGNVYRSVVVKNQSHLIDTVGAVEDVNKFWLSQPNPSKFAVECLYFDISDGGDPTTLDRVLVDPITTGPVFHIYYSNEGDPGTDDATWESRIWTQVPATFRLNRREEHALPEPITAKYVCLEFSHLQAMAYNPGRLAQPTAYKKHPKWVLDYFLARYNAQRTTEDPFIADAVTVVYDALDIAYNYYLDDLHQEPRDPQTVAPASQTTLTSFLKSRTDISDQVDASTFNLIKTSLAPYTDTTSSQGKLDYLPFLYGPNSTNADPQVETDPNLAAANTAFVSSTDRDLVLLEQNWPVMYFYLPSRHFYRELVAPFTYNRAYFVGLRELAFTRDHYFVPQDNNIYIALGGDSVNLRNNDLIRVGDIWTTNTDQPNPNVPGPSSVEIYDTSDSIPGF